MFRFLHAADIHLDSPLDGLDAYEGAPVEVLRGAGRRAFEKLVELAVAESVDFVLIAGDLYDGDWRDFRTGLFFTRQMRVLKDAGIPVYLIAGNHDAASVLTRRLSLPDNVTSFSVRRAESYRVGELPVVIHGRGFPDRAVTENFVLEYPDAVSGIFNIGLLHTSLNGTRGHDPYAPCSVSDMTARGYDYWALGHVHQPEIVCQSPWIVYSGNIQGRHIRESGARGCRLVTVDEGLQVNSCDFRELDVVRWLTADVDLTNVDSSDEMLDRVGAALISAQRAASGRLAAVRVVLDGVTPLHDQLKSDPATLRASCINQAQIVSGDSVWIEDVQVVTSPAYDIQDLAERDDLTRIVLQTLSEDRSDTFAMPSSITDMLKVLPPEIRDSLQNELLSPLLKNVLDDVRSILLDALQTRGGDS